MNNIIEKIDGERIAENLLGLVAVPSPTGSERAAVLAYADMLRQAGAEVELDEHVPESPAVVGRLRGNRPGKCLQLAGHIDTIHAPHAEPKREGDVISGRGSADMKNGLTGILEALRVLKEGGCNFPGELLVTAYGQHESPWSTHEPLTHLLQNGVKGDAAIVAESFSETAVIEAKGQAIWSIDLRRQGEVCHELSRAPEADHLLEAAVLTINTIKQKNQGLAAGAHNYPLLGSESLFIGQVHYGDFYNRVPIECKLQGTFRWHPHHSFKTVQEDLKETLARAALPKSISVKISWKISGHSYRVDPEEQIIKSQIRSYRNVMGKELETGGTAVITDACRIVRIGKVPTAVLDFGGKMAHADFEFVHLDHVVQACKWLVCLILDYLQSSE